MLDLPLAGRRAQPSPDPAVAQSLPAQVPRLSGVVACGKIGLASVRVLG
jgi:hypothetical protein